MPELTVSISITTHETLLKLAEASGEPVQAILDKAVENYRRSLFLIKANQAFVALRSNDALWQEELQERQDWEQTIADGLV
ncbi:MAG: hypothetical protein RMY34_09445 [Aulosira sp. DedQUE10]|nr:hypothetical protein [Aulosira sp. DedQUE10]